MRKHRFVYVLGGLLLALTMDACGNALDSAQTAVTPVPNTANAAASSATGASPNASVAQGTSANFSMPSSITIAYQPGLGYANLIVLKQQKTLEQAFPKTTFTWKVLSNGATIRDGMVAGQIQIGSGGIAPFLVGWDKNVKWKLLSGLDELDIWLMTKDPNIQSLKDIKSGQKIGLPAPDSIQALVLRQAAQNQVGNAKAFDNALIAVDHPLGVQSLQSGQLTAHLTTPPFQFQEQAAGAHAILHSFDVFGQSTSLGVFITDDFNSKYPDFVKWFYQQLVSSTAFIKANPDAAAQLLSQEDKGATTAAQYKTWLADKSIIYDTGLHGILKYAASMKQTGYLSKTPGGIGDVAFADITGGGD